MQAHPSHPPPYGPALTTALVKFVNENQDDWDVHTKSVLFAYRTSKNDSTKFKPFKFMLGLAPVPPVDGNQAKAQQ